MDSNISSVNSQQATFTSAMNSGAAAQKPQQAEQQAASVKSLQPAGFSSITYSSKGKVEPAPAQSSANTGFQAFA